MNRFPCLQRLLIVLALVGAPALRMTACDDNHGDQSDPVGDPPPDPNDQGAWGDNGDGTFTWVPESSEGGDSPGTPAAPPAISWLSLPAGPLNPGDAFLAEAQGNDPAGLLSAVSVDISPDGGVSWNGFAYGGGGDGSVAASGNPGSAQAGAAYQFRAWAVDSLGQNSGMLFSPVFPVSVPPAIYPLAISAAGPGSVSTNGGNLPADTVVTVSATPGPAGRFTGWSGDRSGADNPLTITLTGPTSVVAQFTPTQVTLALETSGNGTASGAGTFPIGSRTAIQASPGANAVFAGWTPRDAIDDASAASTTLTLNQDLDVTAIFTAALAQLDTRATGPGIVQGGGTYPLNASATLTATPAPGSRFTGWSGDLSGVANPATVVMTANKTVTGTFGAQLPQAIAVTAVPPQPVGASAFGLQAVATSGLPVSFQLTGGPASLVGATVNLTGPTGTVTLLASQPGNEVYAPAPPVAFSFPVIAKQSRTVLSSSAAATKKNTAATPVPSYLLAPSHP